MTRLFISQGDLYVSVEKFGSLMTLHDRRREQEMTSMPYWRPWRRPTGSPISLMMVSCLTAGRCCTWNTGEGNQMHLDGILKNRVGHLPVYVNAEKVVNLVMG